MINHIKYINIHNFKGIKELKVDDMKSINIFVGDNNTGKTTVLESIQLFERPFDILYHLKLLSRKYSQRGINYNKIKEIFNECDLNNEIKINIQIDDTNNKFSIKGYEEEVMYVGDDYFDDEESIERILLKYNFNMEEREYQIENKNKAHISSSKTHMKVINIGYVNPIDTYMEQSTLKAIDTVIKIGKKDKLISLLKIFDDKIIDLNYISDKEIYITREGKNILSLSSFGDGLKKAIVLISKVIDATNGVLLVDEIETGTHKDILGNIFNEVIKNSNEYNTQIVATTHSREALESMLEMLEENLENIALYRLENFRGKLYARRFSGEDAHNIIIKEGGDLR